MAASPAPAKEAQPAADAAAARSRRREIQSTLPAMSLAVICAARGAEPTEKDLRDEIAALRAEVAELRAAQQAQRQPPAAASQTAVADEVMNDADRRSRLFSTDASFIGGWDPAKQ